MSTATARAERPAHADAATRWVDAEVHLMPPAWCDAAFDPGPGEPVLRRVVYDHPEREAALRRATAEAALAEMDAAGIERAVIMGLPWRCPDRCREHNLYIADCVRRHPRRFIGLGVLPPPRSIDPVGAVREILDEHGLTGVKVIPSWQSYRLDDDCLAPALEVLCERRAPLMTHVDHPYLDPAAGDGPHRLLAIAQRLPELRIIAAHLGGLLCLYHHHAPLRSALANMLFVASVPLTMRMALYAVDAVGAERVVFGSDFPFNPSHDQRSVRRALEALPLEPDQLRRVAGAEALLAWLEGARCA